MRRPSHTSHRSAHRLAQEVALSAATVHRFWRMYGLQPRLEDFRLVPTPSLRPNWPILSGFILAAETSAGLVGE
jgi:hypothetical protein